MSESTYTQKASASDTIESGAFAFDTISSVDYAVSKLAFGDVDTITRVTSSAGLPVQLLAGSAAIGSVTVTGGATAANQATEIASLASIDAKTPALGQALAAASIPVVLTAAQLSTLTPPAAITGFATAANQTTGNASLATIAGAVSGTEMQVDVVSMPNVTIAGTVTVAAHAVTNAGTFAVQVDGAALTSLQLLDDSVATAGSAITSKGLAAVGTDGTNARILKTDTSGELQVDVLTMPTVAVTGTFWQATQPVSLASVPSHAVTNAGTFAVQAAQSGTWTVQPGNTANTTAWLVTGTGGTFPVTDSGGSLTIDAPVGTPAFVRLSDGSSAITTLPVSLASVPSHAVTNAGTFAVQSTLQAGTNYAGKLRLTDGTTDAEVVPLTGYNAQAVAIVDGSGNQITTFGGGTQYTEGDTDASITGTAMLWEDTSDTLRAVSASKPLPVNIISGAGSGGTAAADDADFTAGTTSGTPVMGVYESSPTSVTDGDMGIVGITATRALKTSAVQSGTWNVGTVTAVTGITNALPAGSNKIGAVNLVDNTGGDISESSIGLWVQGSTAHDAAASQKPLLVGGYASAAAPTSVSGDGNAVRAWFLRNGSQATTLTAAGALIGGDATNGLDVDVTRLPSLSSNTLGTVTTVSAVTAITNALPAGTNAIGKLAANSGVDIGDVDVTSQPARAATTDTITAKLATDAIHNGTTALTPKFAAIAASSSGNNTLVAAVTSKKIRVLAYNLIGNGAVNAKFQSGASGTDLTGLKYIAAAGGGICAPFNPVGWFESASGVLLNLNLSGAVAVGGELVYVEV